jgi:muramoyltetrapeptide carboxypeptidase LdcA involved in peptidoglycan recycling
MSFFDITTECEIKFQKLPKLRDGDSIAIISPSFAAPAKWPNVYQLGLKRVRDVFHLVPVEYPTTSKLGASGEERAKDILSAFSDHNIKAVIASLGGDDQITYIWKYLKKHAVVFKKNPKPFFGYSDNTHLINFLWLNGIPSFYGGSIFTEFAMQGQMDDFTVNYLKKAMFSNEEIELTASPEFSDEGLNWSDDTNLNKRRRYQKNDGWYWDGLVKTEGITWGGCIESIDELLRHGAPIPSLEQFENIILIAESSEELPSADYVHRVFRALGERGILVKIKGVVIGRPKSWEFDKPNTDDQKIEYKKQQRAVILETVRIYNSTAPVVQNLDFGHSSPQIPMPMGRKLHLNSANKKIIVAF